MLDRFYHQYFLLLKYQELYDECITLYHLMMADLNDIHKVHVHVWRLEVVYLHDESGDQTLGHLEGHFAVDSSCGRCSVECHTPISAPT